MVVKMDASCSPKGRISERVEMELSAGSIKIVGPCPRQSMPTWIVLSRQLNSRLSNVICSTYRSASRRVLLARGDLLQFAEKVASGERGSCDQRDT